MPPAPGIHVTPARDAEITRLVGALTVALGNVAVEHDTMREHYDNIQSRWWQLAVDIHRSGEHAGARAHILDWSTFIRGLYSVDHLTQILRCIYKNEWAAAKRKHAGKLANAQKAMALSETIELVLEIGPDACKNNQIVSAISSLRKPTNHDPILPATIRQGLLQKLVDRIENADMDDGGPILSRAELSDAIKEMKAAAPVKAGAAQKRSRKRKSRGAADDDEREESDEPPENPRKRSRVDADVRMSLADDYIHRLRESGSTLLDENEHVAPLDQSDESIFGFFPVDDDDGPSLVLPPGSHGAELLSRLETSADMSEGERNDTQAELDALIQQQHDQDELLREQLELLSRFRSKGPAVVDGGLGAMMNPLLESVFRSAEGILAVGKSGGVLAYLEARRRQRKALNWTPGNEDGCDE